MERQMRYSIAGTVLVLFVSLFTARSAQAQTCGVTMTCNTSSTAFPVVNNGNGSAGTFTANNSDTPALVGTNNHNYGIEFQVGVGVKGEGSKIGVFGTSTKSIGVGGDGYVTGVHGYGNSSGVYGESPGVGVQGKSTAFYGVRGQSTSSDGVHGISASSNGVYGTSTSWASPSFVDTLK